MVDTDPKDAGTPEEFQPKNIKDVLISVTSRVRELEGEFHAAVNERDIEKADIAARQRVGEVAYLPFKIGLALGNEQITEGDKRTINAMALHAIEMLIDTPNDTGRFRAFLNPMGKVIGEPNDLEVLVNKILPTLK